MPLELRRPQAAKSRTSSASVELLVGRKLLVLLALRQRLAFDATRKHP
jgi:hypothetical protein